MDLRSGQSLHPVLRALDEHMASHHGVIDLASATALGASRHIVRDRVASGAWQQVYRGVYRTASAPRTPEQRLLAAVLACGPGAIASHRSAAWLWKLLAQPPDIPEVTIPHNRTTRQPGITVYRSKDIVATTSSLRSGIRVTGPARGIMDTSGVVGPEVTALMIDRAIAAKLLTVPALFGALEQFGRRGRRGTAALRAALDARGVSAPTHAPSVLESAMARLLKQTNVASPLAEFRVAGGKVRFDFAWPDILFAIEVLGWAGHSAYDDWLRNVAKRNWCTKNGWELLEVTWEDLIRRPAWVAKEIRERISRRRLAAS
jgi:predicted transcriptional regulator of viral defense system